jgi:hypothetical protein
MRAYSTLLALLVLASAPLKGQDPRGAIEGEIADKTGGGIAGARVSARSLDTGLAMEVLTPPSGLFRLPLLPIGQYSLTVEAAKFAKYGSEQAFVELPNWRALGMAAAFATDGTASERSVARSNY